MLKNKKAQKPEWFMILIILAIVGLIFGVTFLIGFKGSGVGNIRNKICKYTNQMRTKFGILGPMEDLRPGAIVPKMPKFCTTSLEQIAANDWGKCDTYFENQYNGWQGIAKDELEALRGCAAHQIIDLAWQCWDMGGQGTLEPESWMCFTVQVGTELQGEVDVDKVYLKLRKNLKKELGCSPDSEKDYGITHSDCSKLLDILPQKLVDKLVHSNTIEMYENMIIQGYTTKNEEKLGLTDCVKENVDIIDLFTQITDASKVESILQDTVVTSKKGCEGVISFVKEKMNRIDSERDGIDKINADIHTEIKDALGVKAENPGEPICTKKDESGNCIEEFNPTQLDVLLETTFEIGSKLPELGEIDKEYLYEIMRTTNVKDEYYTYTSVIPKDKLEVIADFKIIPGSLFEIGFCDPPLPIGSGVVQRFTCGFKCEIVNGEWECGEKQRIQLASGGGGAGGISRVGSPYPSYCQLGNVLNLPVARELRKGCEIIVGGVTRRI